MRKYIDIHSHIIFGADDGAETPDEAIELLKLDRDEGAYAVFATPHYGHENVGEPDAFEVLRKFELLKERAAEEVPEITLYMGTEWYCAWDLADRIRQGEAFRMNGTDYILTEFLEYEGAYETPEKIFGNLMELKNQGFRPILAHPERYKAMQEDWNRLKELADNGVLLQVNAYDLEVNKSPETKDLARWLAKEHMITFLGSDMHRTVYRPRPPKVKEGIDWLYANVEEAYADAVTFGNAEKLLGCTM